MPAEELLDGHRTQQSPQVKDITSLGRTQLILPIGVPRIGSAVAFIAAVGISFVTAVGITLVGRVVTLITGVIIAGVLRTTATEVLAAIAVARGLSLMRSAIQRLRPEE
jgi:hypothetical protein